MGTSYLFATAFTREGTIVPVEGEFIEDQYNDFEFPCPPPISFPNQESIQNFASDCNKQTAQVHLLCNNANGEIFHKILRSGIDWIQLSRLTNPFYWGQNGDVLSGPLCCSLDKDQLVQVFVISDKGNVFHNAGTGQRSPNIMTPVVAGGGFGWYWNKMALTSDIAEPRDVACAADPLGNLHLFLIDSNAVLWHAVKYQADPWQNWTKVPTANSNGTNVPGFKKVSCAANPEQVVQICVIDENGFLWYALFVPYGSNGADGYYWVWEKMPTDTMPTNGAVPPQEIKFSRISCATDASDILHITALPNDIYLPEPGEIFGFPLLYTTRQIGLVGPAMYSAWINAVKNGINQSISTLSGMALAHN